MKIYLVTKNTGKIAAAQSAFAGTSITLIPVDKDYPEIQADTSAEIARYTALQAAKDYDAPAIREDHSLFIHALGIPGPYTSFFEKKVPVAALLQLLVPFEDRTGYFEVAAAYVEPNGTIRDFSFRVPISFAKEERGELQKGWSRIIMFQGEQRTIAEYPESERTDVWNKNYLAIAKQFKDSGVS